MILLGRDADADESGGPTGHLGACLARDGSRGARVEIDLDRSHAAVVVGKRGYGKSYTLGVLAEELVTTAGVTPVVVDPMGAFEQLATSLDGARRVAHPTVQASAVPPSSWPALLGLSPTSGAGGLVWRAAAQADTLTGMCEWIQVSKADLTARRAAENHLGLASSWDVFDSDGLSAAELLSQQATVIDCSGLADAPMNAVVRAIGSDLYETCVSTTPRRLPWLLVDEAHAFFGGDGAEAPTPSRSDGGGIAAPALKTILTRGRAPGVSLVLATQRPAALPPAAVSQADVLLAHRLTTEPDLQAVARARPTYANRGLRERLPDSPGEVVLVDDTTEAVHAVQIRKRKTPHDGDSARVSERKPVGRREREPADTG